MKSLIVSSALIIAGVSASAAPTATGSGFPGDKGRPFDGLPFPPGPLPPRPPGTPGSEGSRAGSGAQEAAKAMVDWHARDTMLESVSSTPAGTPKLYYIPDGTDGSTRVHGISAKPTRR